MGFTEVDNPYLLPFRRSDRISLHHQSDYEVSDEYLFARDDKSIAFVEDSNQFNNYDHVEKVYPQSIAPVMGTQHLINPMQHSKGRSRKMIIPYMFPLVYVAAVSRHFIGFTLRNRAYRSPQFLYAGLWGGWHAKALRSTIFWPFYFLSAKKLFDVLKRAMHRRDRWFHATYAAMAGPAVICKYGLKATIQSMPIFFCFGFLMGFPIEKMAERVLGSPKEYHSFAHTPFFSRITPSQEEMKQILPFL